MNGLNINPNQPEIASASLKVTVITPSFNQGKFIRKTIESVLSQDYPNVEYFVIDGGSTDDTLDILRSYGDKVRWISEKDRGQSDAINKGFRLATGEIVAWLNSDDVYLPRALSKVARYFSDHSNVMMVYGEGNIIDENDATKCRFPFTERSFDLTKLIYYGDYILQQTSFYRRSVFDSIPMLEESYHYTMDWDLFIRIGKRFPVGYISEDLACIREHGTAKTALGGKERFREIVKMIRQHSVMRYPPAYFNYMWDAYGKDVFDDYGRVDDFLLKRKLLSLTKRSAQHIFSKTGLQQYNGQYPDGWVGPKALVVIPNLDPRSAKAILWIAGEVTEPNLPLKICVRVNRKYEQSVRVVKAGEFEAALPLSEKVNRDDSFHIELISDRSYVPAHFGAKDDTRSLAFILKTLEIR